MARVAKTTRTIAAPVAPVVSQVAEGSKRALPIIVVLVVLLLSAVGTAGYFYYQYHNTPAERDAKEIAKLTKEIGAVMELPTGEVPTLATVTDKGKLAEQPFFQMAENGDKVLIYTSTGRTILYRPGTHKIIDMTVVNVKPSGEITAAEPEPAPAPVPASVPVEQVTLTTVTLYNGSAKIGVTNTLEDTLKVTYPDLTVALKDKAAKNDYQGNLVVDLSGKNSELVKKLAGSIGGIVGALPVGETAPSTDMLIIVGNKK